MNDMLWRICYLCRLIFYRGTHERWARIVSAMNTWWLHLRRWQMNYMLWRICYFCCFYRGIHLRRTNVVSTRDTRWLYRSWWLYSHPTQILWRERRSPREYQWLDVYWTWLRLKDSLENSRLRHFIGSPYSLCCLSSRWTGTMLVWNTSHRQSYWHSYRKGLWSYSLRRKHVNLWAHWVLEQTRKDQSFMGCLGYHSMSHAGVLNVISSDYL